METLGGDIEDVNSVGLHTTFAPVCHICGAACCPKVETNRSQCGGDPTDIKYFNKLSNPRVFPARSRVLAKFRKKFGSGGPDKDIF